MKKIFALLIPTILLVFTACQPIQTPPPQVPEEKLFEPLANETPTDKVQIRYAQNFTLEYQDGAKILTVLQPWAGAAETFTYVLIPRGSEKHASIENGMVIETPVRSFVSMSTTYFPFLEAIGKMDALVGVDDATYVYNETVRTRAEAGELTIVGGGAGGGSVNVEVLLDLDPDIIMTSASGSPEFDAHPKLLEAGLPVVINADYLEQSPLGRAEWGIFIAAFFDLEAQAMAQFDALVQRYEEVKLLAAGIEERVTVFTNTDYQGSWYMPGADSYAGILLRDAGADYLWADLPGSGANPLAFEVVFERAQDADFWINVGFPADLDSLLGLDSRYSDFEAFQTGSIYNYNLRTNANGGLDYYESGVANPDVVLKDLVNIFYPELLPDHTLYYYQQLR